MDTSILQDPHKVVAVRKYYWEHPEAFAKDILNIKLTPYQKQIMDSVRENRITTVASCNAAGKTGTAGIVVPWFLLSWDESIVVTTAPTWRQVKDLLWREINTRYEKAKERGIDLGPEKPNVVSWQIKPNWFAVGVSSKDPTKVMGYHADSGRLLAICDEASGIEELIFEGIDSITTSALCRTLYIGNPVSGSGRFRESHKPQYLSNKIKISAFDTPNFKANGIRDEDDLINAIETKRELAVPYPQLVSPIWVYERIKIWGINSPMYQAKVRANFPDVGENTLIPLSWIEEATSDKRLDSILGLNLPDPTPEMNPEAAILLEKKNDIIRKEALDEYIRQQNTSRGVDVARFGSDSTVITPRWGKIIGAQKSFSKLDTMQTAGRVWPMINNIPTDVTGIDVIGVGGGVVDRLHELQREQEALGHGQWAQILGVDVATAATEKPDGLSQMEFANKRAELYWRLRNMFEAGDIYIMPNEHGNIQDELMAELSAIQYEFRGNKIFIEEKKEMKKRLLKSPDHADSLMLSLEVSQGGGWSIAEEDESLMNRRRDDDNDDDEPARREAYDEDSEFSSALDDMVY